ncbi:Rv3235 family protein [Spirillospora albida]|uniref:Rv3235 family protein n=1 Tax=Spirillospora albida TaxID=58123 RepID=UPI000689B0AC|nr:Rv3235 family protein [Spirillospora albida]
MRPHARFAPPPPIDGALALTQPPPPPRPRLRLVRPAEAPDASAPTTAAIRLIIEVISGACPPHRLARLATPKVLRHLESARSAPRGRTARAAAPGPASPHGRTAPPEHRVVPPRVLAEWAQMPADGVAEAGAVVVVGGRVHALALRMELLRGRWRCTALETTAG